MKLSIKIWLCSIAVMAVAFGIGGYFFVNDVFEASMEREIKQAMDESSILRILPWKKSEPIWKKAGRIL